VNSSTFVKQTVQHLSRDPLYANALNFNRWFRGTVAIFIQRIMFISQVLY